MTETQYAKCKQSWHDEHMKWMAKLKRKGVLRRLDPDRGGHWEIIGGDNE